MQVVPHNKEGYNLLFQGVRALSDMQLNGIRVDIPYCKKIFKELGQKIKAQKKKVHEYDEIIEWKKKYGKNFNLDSGPQMQDILFNEFKYEPVAYTATGQPATSKEALQALRLGFTDDLLYYRRLSKVKNTYIANIINEAHNGVLHPFFNLHTVRTFRGSSNNPNVQNMPIRDPEIGEMVRRAFIPRNDHYLIEGDYGGIEIKGACWCTKDPTMLKYLRDPETADMHADFMSQLFHLPQYNLKHDGDKTLRKGTKNGFTFPQFYGDYYKDCAVLLWTWAGLQGNKIKSNQGIKISNGKLIGKHLIDNGIKNFKQFEQHVKKIEKHMWYNSFPEYRKWKESVYNWYINHGYLTSLSGVTFQGVMSRNDAVNYPIQCICFHCLLWSIIKINKLLKKYRMKTLPVMQIHDSLITDTPKNERNDYLDIMKQVMCVDIKQHFDFINTPLELEVESSELNGAWHKMDTILEYIN